MDSKLYDMLKEKHANERLIMSPFAEIKFKPVKSQDTAFFKPVGLWYGHGTEWVDWVRSEMPDWETAHIFEIKVDPTKILRINDIRQIMLFTHAYSLAGSYKSQIDWHQVAEKYSGIEIIPYQYKKRFDLMWYYPWDVASGCVWNKDAVVSITKIV